MNYFFISREDPATLIVNLLIRDEISISTTVVLEECTDYVKAIEEIMTKLNIEEKDYEIEDVHMGENWYNLKNDLFNKIKNDSGKVEEIAEGIVKYEENFIAYYNNKNSHTTIKEYEEDIVDEYKSKEDFVRYYFEGEICSDTWYLLNHCIDWDEAYHQILSSGDYYDIELDNSFLVFRNN